MSSFRLFSLLFVSATLAFAQQAATPKIKTVPVRLSGTMDGAELYREHCAVCHGVDGKGGGPAAPALKRSTGDLTRMSAQNGGKFPTLAAQEKLRSGSVIEHGSVEMPMWGKLLQPAGGTKNDAEMRLHALVNYLEKIQAR
jgi:mono/diheme cytochrome c family protein